MLLNKRISIWYFITQIKYQLFLIIFFAIFVGYIDTHPWLQDINFPLPITAMLGTAVSLLLAFRTAQSYERWWEARKIWGAIVNDSRNFIREVCQFLSEEYNKDVQEFSERQIVWVIALGESLRKQPFSQRVIDFLVKHEIEASNIPNALIAEHAEHLKRLSNRNAFTEFQTMQLNSVLAGLCNNMGMCERIKNTVFPKAYSLLIHTLIYLFTFLLPFGLDDSKIMVEIALTILIPVVFISIEKTAIIMQDPFENSPVDIPMTALAQTIELNIKDLIGETYIVHPTNSNLYYQM